MNISSRYRLRGIRIGEASHPSPPRSQLRRAQRPPGLSHDNPRTPNVHILETRRFKDTTKIPRKDPKRKKEERKIVAEEGKNARNFGPPPFGAPPFGASTPSRPHTLSSKNSPSINWPKSKLAEVEIGRSRSRSKNAREGELCVWKREHKEENVNNSGRSRLKMKKREKCIKKRKKGKVQDTQ